MAPLLEVVSLLAVLQDMVLLLMVGVALLLLVTVGRLDSYPSRSLRGHPETYMLLSKMGWEWVTAQLPEPASQ